jgi:methyl-accepting chemotaxis protein
MGRHRTEASIHPSVFVYICVIIAREFMAHEFHCTRILGRIHIHHTHFNAMNAIVERLFPQSLRSADAEVQRRARLVLQICIIGMLLSVVYCPILLSYPNYIGAGFGALGCCVFILTAIVFRATGSITLAGHCLSANALVVFTATVLTSGGLRSQASPWLVFAPLLAVLLMGRKQSRLWLALLLVVYGVLIVLEANDMTPPNAIPASRLTTAWASSMIAFSVVLYIVVVVFEGGKKQLMALLIEEKAGIEEKVREARAELRREQETARARDQKILEDSQEQQEYLQSSVAHILHGVEQVSQGNLIIQIDTGSHGEWQHDEIQRLADGLNQAVHGISQLLRKVREVANTTGTAGADILGGVEQMAHSASTQARKASEAANRIADLTEQMQHGAASARASAEVAESTVQGSQEGSGRIQEAITGMGSIAFVVAQSADTIRTLGNSSQQIGEIVEAARAGDQGRGFAVVADEVRKLAERTTKATKEIAGMIHRIQHDTQQAVSTIERGTSEVDRGTRMVEEAGKSFMTTMHNAQRGATAFSTIALGIEQRASAFDSIADDVQSIIGSMESSVQMTHHIEHSVESLTRLVRELLQLLQQFTIDNPQEHQQSRSQAHTQAYAPSRQRNPERLAKSASSGLALR